MKSKRCKKLSYQPENAKQKFVSQALKVVDNTCIATNLYAFLRACDP